MRVIQPEHGKIRIVTKFAFLPVTIERETRWLEKVMIKQQYQFYYSGSWSNIKFVDNLEGVDQYEKVHLGIITCFVDWISRLWGNG